MHPKPKRGGPRPGSGRPPISGEGVTRHTVGLRPSDLAYLRTLDANLSAAIRLLIDRQQALERKRRNG